MVLAVGAVVSSGLRRSEAQSPYSNVRGFCASNIILGCYAV